MLVWGIRPHAKGGTPLIHILYDLLASHLFYVWGLTRCGTLDYEVIYSMYTWRTGTDSQLARSMSGVICFVHKAYTLINRCLSWCYLQGARGSLGLVIDTLEIKARYRPLIIGLGPVFLYRPLNGVLGLDIGL